MSEKNLPHPFYDNAFLSKKDRGKKWWLTEEEKEGDEPREDERLEESRD